MVLLAYWADLSRIQVEILELYTGFRSRQTSSHHVIHTVSELDRKLAAWKDGLQDTLRYDPEDNTKPAAVRVLHLAYLSALIVLHRPLTAFGDNGFGFTFSQSILDSYGMNRNEPTDPANRCRSAALEIARTLKKIITTFPHKQLPTMLTRMSFIASTTLLFGILRADESQREQFAQDRACLLTCLETLGLVEQLFPSAKYTRSLVQKIVRSNSVDLGENVVGGSPVSMTDIYNGLMQVDWAMGPSFGLPSDYGWMQQSMDPLLAGDPSYLQVGNDQMPMTEVDSILGQQNLDPTVNPARISMQQYDLPYQGGHMM
jgi:hypothetical protein